jgi:hypothetical protein
VLLSDAILAKHCREMELNMVRLAHLCVSIRSITNVLGLSIAIMLLHGCITATLDVPLPENRPLVEKLPLKVGIYYSPEFLTCKFSTFAFYYNIVYSPGPESMESFNYTFESIFTDVVYLDTLPPLIDRQMEVDFIIKPNIEDSVVELIYPTDTNVYFATTHRRAEINYLFVFQAPDGSETSSWKIRGTGIVHGSITDMFKHYFQFFIPIKQSIQYAIYDASAKFLAEIQENKELMKWMQDQKGMRARTSEQANE